MIPNLSSEYVLIADDDPDALEALSLIVETLGLAARIAEDGEQALAIAFQSTPALVLLDVMMPKLNGLSVVAKLFSSPSTRDVPIILVSADIQNEKSLRSLPNVAGIVQKADFTVSGMMQMIAHTLHIEVPASQIGTKSDLKLRPRPW